MKESPGLTMVQPEVPPSRNPGGIAVDGDGNVYVADTGNYSIRKISPAGLVTTIATDIREPSAIAVDERGNVFAGDSDNGLILRITPGGDVTTWANVLDSPSQILLGPGGNLYMLRRAARYTG